jgi:hypothetical protein
MRLTADQNACWVSTPSSMGSNHSVVDQGLITKIRSNNSVVGQELITKIRATCKADRLWQHLATGLR